MRNIIELVKRLYMLLLFIALQLVALLIYFSVDKHHNAAWLNTSTSVVGKIQSWRTEISDYLRLGEINDELSIQNSLLREELRNNYTRVSGPVYSFNDTLYLLDWEYRTARVVNNTVNYKNNYITIDKGTAGGIKPGMGLLANNSIVGKVVKVSEHFAVAMSLLHENFTATVKMKGSGVFGTLKWNDGNYQFAHVAGIPKEIKVQRGDTVVTTGFSAYFPAECMVGVVDHFETLAEENVYRIRIKLSTNFRKLHYVDVVNKTALEEQEKIELETETEFGARDSQ